MNFTELIPLTAAVINFGLTLFVLSRGVRPVINRVYLLWGLSITVWNTGVFFMFIVKTPEQALFWARFLQFGVIFLPVSLLHLSLLVAQVSRPRLLLLLYGTQFLLAVSNFSGHFVAGVVNVGYAYYSLGGPFFWCFVGIYFCLTSSTVVMLFRKLRTLPPMHRGRVKSLLWASVILIIFGNNDILPILGIYHYPFTSVRVFPIGSLAAIFYGILVTYSVLQHQLLDIHVTLSRVVAHAVRVGFLFLIGTTLLLLITLLAPKGAFTVTSVVASLCVFVISGVVASIYFPRLFGSGSEMLERRILGDRFEYHDRIRSFISRMQFLTDKNELMGEFHNLMLKTVCVSNYQIILLDETTHVFSLFQSYPEEAAKTFPDLHSEAPVFRFFKEQKVEYLSVSKEHASSRRASLEQEAREQLSQSNAEFCFPFLFDDDPFGLLLLGKKNSGEPYTSTDLNLFALLVKNLSLMINQIRLKNQILQTQELELLGRMSRGMAHDLNNLLTPIWTLLQLVGEGASTQDLSEDLLPVALRNIKTMRAYIRESLFFSENLRPDFQLGRLDVLIQHAVDTTQARREPKGIQVLIDTPGEVLVEMDEVLIQRLITNIIANASDASPPDSTIRVELVRLVRTEMNRDWLRVRIIDNGEGIEPANLNRVLTPYFTTKDRGDKDRGFGLGLAICRKIVHLHGGNLNIASQLKKGTTVQVDLPSRQMKLTEQTPSLT